MQISFLLKHSPHQLWRLLVGLACKDDHCRIHSVVILYFSCSFYTYSLEFFCEECVPFIYSSIHLYHCECMGVYFIKKITLLFGGWAGDDHKVS